MAEVAILAAVKVLGSPLVNEALKFIISKFSELSELGSGIRNIRDELLVMQAFLNGINMDGLNNEAFEVWLEQVRDLAFRVEDTLDEFIYRVGNEKYRGVVSNIKLYFKPKSSLKKTISFADMTRIASELKEAEKSLRNLAARKDHWVSILENTGHLKKPDYYSNESPQCAAVCAHFIEENKLVGAEKNKELLKSWLYSNKLNRAIISVWGMGGLGKTTLVTNVFKTEKNNFSCHAWVSVSQTYKDCEILRNLISEIYESEEKVPIDTSNTGLKKLKEILRGILKEKRYLIILDDIWDAKAFRDIQDALIDSHKGSRIVITSRNEDVASLALKEHRLALQPLKESESWELFCISAFPIETYCEPVLNQNWIIRHAAYIWFISGFVCLTALPLFCVKSKTYQELGLNHHGIKGVMSAIWFVILLFLYYHRTVPEPGQPPLESVPYHECPCNLENWARKIVSKCGGLPLALVSIGGMLFLREKNEFEWKRVHDQLNWELDHNKEFDRLRNILNLSFNYLRAPLKKCFLYCCMFPEDHLLARKKLIRLWIAEGFIEERGLSTLEEVAEGYMVELVRRSMLQLVRTNHFGRIKRCRMHDTLRELAISVCMKENFGFVHEDNKKVRIDTTARRLSIIKSSNEISCDEKLSRLRTFLSFHSSMLICPFLSSTLLHSMYLSILDLEGLPVESLPETIGDLFNLRYLGLRSTKVKSLPMSIGRLHNLQTLDLLFSNIEKLPDSIANLIKLRHLFAKSFTDSIGISVPNGMFDFKELQTLQGLEANAEVIERLGNLNQLRSFKILNVKESYCADLCTSLSKMLFLSFLHILSCSENEFLRLELLNPPPKQLQKLDLTGRLEETFFESSLFQISGKNLHNLGLFMSQLQKDPLPSLSYLSGLTSLFLLRAYDGQKLVFGAGWFPKLKILVLEQLPSLIHVEMEKGTMMSLEQINMVHMRQLVEIPKGMEQITSLQFVYCSVLSPHFWGSRPKGFYQLKHFRCLIC